MEKRSLRARRNMLPRPHLPLYGLRQDHVPTLTQSAETGSHGSIRVRSLQRLLWPYGRCLWVPMYANLTQLNQTINTNFTPGILAAIHRTRIRRLYHLEGSFGTDCVKALCCCCCVIMQNEREVRDREDMIRRHAGPAAGAAGYVAPGTMTYAPPPR